MGQLETLATASAYSSAYGLLWGRNVIHFIDNVQALTAMASGASRDRVAARLVHMFHASNVAVRASTWFEYVPSAANVSDLPSRNEFAWLHARGSVPCLVDVLTDV